MTTPSYILCLSTRFKKFRASITLLICSLSMSWALSPQYCPQHKTKGMTLKSLSLEWVIIIKDIKDNKKRGFVSRKGQGKQERKGKKTTGFRDLQYPAPCVPHSFQLILTQWQEPMAEQGMKRLRNVDKTNSTQQSWWNLLLRTERTGWNTLWSINNYLWELEEKKERHGELGEIKENSDFF